MKIILLLTIILTGCSTVYYNVWEAFGKEKRDLLKSNIYKSNDDQKKVKKQFEDTLTKIRTKYDFNGGKLETVYDQLQQDNKKAKHLANKYEQRVDKVESIAEDLFKEWYTEAQTIQNKKYKADSLNKRKKTKANFEKMLAKMEKVEKSLDPVLTKLNDQVIYLKHNLNSKSLGAFKGEFKTIETEINKLVASIKISTSETESFIKELE